MSPSPIGLDAYGGLAGAQRPESRPDLNRVPRELTRALSAEEMQALEASFGPRVPAPAPPRPSVEPALGRHVDILA
jgi:hypothetical protein